MKTKMKNETFKWNRIEGEVTWTMSSLKDLCDMGFNNGFVNNHSTRTQFLINYNFYHNEIKTELKLKCHQNKTWSLTEIKTKKLCLIN